MDTENNVLVEITKPIQLKSFKEYTTLQVEKIIKGNNLQNLRKKLGREPTHDELMQYYLSSGQANAFRKKYSYPEDKG